MAAAGISRDLADEETEAGAWLPEQSLQEQWQLSCW